MITGSLDLPTLVFKHTYPVHASIMLCIVHYTFLFDVSISSGETMVTKFKKLKCTFIIPNIENVTCVDMLC